MDTECCAITNWNVSFESVGNILFYEPFTISGVYFSFEENNKFKAVMKLNVPHHDYERAEELAYERIMNIFTVIVPRHVNLCTNDTLKAV